MRHLTLIFILSTLISCKSTGKVQLPSSGSPGELIVVIDNSLWDGSAGETVRETVGAWQFGLPQEESLFQLINIPHSAFSNVFQIHRNILIVNIDNDNVKTKDKIEYKKNAWARDQFVVRINAQNVDEFVELLNLHKEDVVNKYQMMELNRLAERNHKLGPDLWKTEHQEKFGLKLTPQKDMEIALDSSDLCWLRIERERPVGGYQHQISQGILVYKKSYTDTAQISKSGVINLRNWFTKKHIPGGSKNSYMVVSEKMVLPESREIQFKGNYGIETRGLWRMENGHMGGPFYNLTFIDEKRNSIVGLDAYVYAPQFRKREYLRELEAILWSISPI